MLMIYVDRKYFQLYVLQHKPLKLLLSWTSSFIKFILHAKRFGGKNNSEICNGYKNYIQMHITAHAVLLRQVSS